MLLKHKKETVEWMGPHAIADRDFSKDMPFMRKHQLVEKEMFCRRTQILK